MLRRVIMPRERKEDILGQRWEYTLLADDYSEIDRDAKGLNPPAGTMIWSGYSYPEIAFSLSTQLKNNGTSGPWWLPDDLLWKNKDLLLSILSKAVILESVPVIKDYLLLNSSVEIVRQETLHVPILEYPKGAEQKSQLSSMMHSLITCAKEYKEIRYTEVVRAIKELYKQDEKSFRIRLCLVEFPHRIWVEGIFHARIHPIIVIPTKVYERYHETVNFG